MTGSVRNGRVCVSLSTSVCAISIEDIVTSKAIIQPPHELPLMLVDFLYSAPT